MRKPPSPRFKEKKRKVFFRYTSLALLLSATGAFYYAFKKHTLVSTIHLELKKDSAWEGAREELTSLLNSKLNSFIGKKMGEVSLNDLLKIARSDPRIGDVYVRRRLPDSFFITVLPGKPLVVWLNPKDGKTYPLSVNGGILPPLASHLVPDLPILRGQEFAKDKTLRKQILQFLSLLPEEKGPFSLKEISEIQYSVKENTFIFILSANGQAIKVGFEPHKTKNKRIESVLRYLNQKNIKWRVIDAQFPQKIVVTTPQAI